MRRRTRARSFFMWAAIAVSGLIIALWAMSLELHVSYQTAARQIDGRGTFVLMSDGFLSAVQFRYRTPVRRGWHIRRAQTHPGSYGLTLPAAQRETWGGYSWLLPLWVPLLVSMSTAVLLWRSGRRLPEGNCRKCGYNLTGNTSGRCPECGAKVNT